MPMNAGPPVAGWWLVVVRAASLADAGAPCDLDRRRPSGDLADVREVLGEDPLGLREDVSRIAVVGERRQQVEVADDAADADVVAEEAGDPGFDAGLLPLGGLAQEVLLLGEAEGDDRALDADRPAGLDQRLERRALADDGHDLCPATPEPFEVVSGLAGGDSDGSFYTAGGGHLMAQATGWLSTAVGLYGNVATRLLGGSGAQYGTTSGSAGIAFRF